MGPLTDFLIQTYIKEIFRSQTPTAVSTSAEFLISWPICRLWVWSWCLTSGTNYQGLELEFWVVLAVSAICLWPREVFCRSCSTQVVKSWNSQESILQWSLLPFCWLLFLKEPVPGMWRADAKSDWKCTVYRSTLWPIKDALENSVAFISEILIYPRCSLDSVADALLFLEWWLMDCFYSPIEPGFSPYKHFLM